MDINMNQVLSMMEQSGLSMDEFFQKLREAEHVKRIEAERAEKARLAAEAKEKARREAEAKRAQFITDVANRALANALTAEDTAWVLREFLKQELKSAGSEDVLESLDEVVTAEEVQALADMMKSAINILPKELQDLLGVSTGNESKSGAKKVVVKTGADADEILKNFIKTIL